VRSLETRTLSAGLVVVAALLLSASPLLSGVGVGSPFLHTAPWIAAATDGAAAQPGADHRAGGSPTASAGAPSIGPTPAAGFTLGWSGADPNAISLNWSMSSDFTSPGYTVLESPNGSTGSYVSVAVVSGRTITSLALTGLTPGSTYWWEVTESGVFGTQTTNPINLTQPTLGYLSYTTPTGTSAWFNWTNNATYGGNLTFVSYILMEQIGSAAPFPATSILSESTMTATISGLSPATSYLFFVNTSDCYAGCGSGAPSVIASQSNVVSLGTPLPLDVSVSSSRSVVDVGQADLFTCTPSGGRSPFTFEWDLGNGTFAPGPGSIGQSFPAPGNVTVTCRVSDATPTQASAATTVEVNSAPTVSISLNRTAVDVTQSISFGCTPANGTAPFNTGWTFGDSVQSSGGFLTHSYATAGSYVATCVAVDGVGSTVTASSSVTVSPALVLAAHVSAAAAAPATLLAFSAVATNGSAGYAAIAWELGDGFSAIGSPVTHGYTSSGDFVATARTTDSNGGSASASVTVSVSSIVLNLSAPVGPIEVGGSLNYSASASGGGGAPFNYSWTFGDGGTAYGPQVTHRFNSTGLFVVSVVVRDTLGANRSVSVSSVSVTPPPPPPPSYTAWYLLALILAAVVVLGVAATILRRRAVDRRLAGQQGRIPPTDPREVARGAKVCPVCGASNRAVRSTCANCGRPL
jgi:hypothetical protein